MGQVIHIVAPSTAYPDSTNELEPAESVLLLAIRWWVADHRQGEDPLPRLCEALRIAGPHDAAFAVDRLMSVVGRTARQPVAIHCPRCPNISGDEQHLLHAASLTQAGHGSLAERVLRTALLSAAGAEFALGPLEGVAELFAEARLLFRRRHAPAPVEHWTPDTAAVWLH
jgi:hypothetical protein